MTLEKLGFLVSVKFHSSDYQFVVEQLSARAQEEFHAANLCYNLGDTDGYNYHQGIARRCEDVSRAMALAGKEHSL